MRFRWLHGSFSRVFKVSGRLSRVSEGFQAFHVISGLLHESSRVEVAPPRAPSNSLQFLDSPGPSLKPSSISLDAPETSCNFLKRLNVSGIRLTGSVISVIRSSCRIQDFWFSDILFFDCSGILVFCFYCLFVFVLTLIIEDKIITHFWNVPQLRRPSARSTTKGLPEQSCPALMNSRLYAHAIVYYLKMYA